MTPPHGQFQHFQTDRFLHHKARQLDLGIYFEANGHGTVSFSEKAREHFAEAASSEDEVKAKAGARLQAVDNVLNPYIGDAVSALLLVVAILEGERKGLDDWAAFYKDLPSRMLKMRVRDRTVVRTTNAERTCTSPPGLQEGIDKLVKAKKSKARRCFVRPSGTEDVVRVYAEADTQEEADRLAEDAKQLVFQLAGALLFELVTCLSQSFLRVDGIKYSFE
eukprot:g44014.t1